MDHMQKNIALLQLFAEGGESGVTGMDAASQTEAAPAAQTAAQEQTEDLQADFEKLIKGKYKAAYDARMQDTISRRLKNAKQAEAQLEAAAPLLRQLAEKYGVQADDIEGLAKAVAEGQSQTSERGAGKLYDTWLRQEQETRELYPAFSMSQSLQDPRFRALLRGGADVRTAFEAVNVERIIPAAMAVAARAVEEGIAKRIASSAARPDENAMGSRAAVVVRTDVSRLSKSDIEEVSRRVARGERVSFG